MKIISLIVGILVIVALVLILGGNGEILNNEDYNIPSNYRTKREIPFISNWFGTTQRALTRKEYIRNNTEDEISQSPRDSRFLSLFTVVRFDNTACYSSSGDNGTCYPQAECIRRGGGVNGRCAQGYGVCCVFSKSCGGSTYQNNTYFTHAGYPTAFDGTGSCQMTIYKSIRDICQFRLDFDSFNIAQPNINGVCNNDQFLISGSTTTTPVICGVNSGNHMYVEVDSNANTPVTISVITSGPTFARTWKIKVTQIRCRSPYKAPDGCLQYFQGVSGTIRTYNFDFVGGQQLANQDYTTCIRMERNFCGIRYNACQDVQAQGLGTGGGTTTNLRSRSFTISGQVTGTALSQVGSMSCTADWVTIPCATNNGRLFQTGMAICQDRLCGDVFNSESSSTAVPVFSFVRPFRITYHTNADEENDSGNRGYCLNFIQQPCTPLQG